VGRDSRNQVPLAHPGSARNAQLTGESLELRELEACKAAALSGCGR
jgi:hypothetical protein